MLCTKCSGELKVLDSRVVKELNIIKRRRECINCKHRMFTLEIVVNTDRVTNDVFFKIDLISNLLKVIQDKYVLILKRKNKSTE